MDVDFYTRLDDYTVIQDVLEISDEISLLITQIQTCLFTNRYDVIGQQDFGMNLEDLLFTFELDSSSIKTKVLKTIYNYCALAQKYEVDCEVVFKQTDIRDIAFIDITINGVSSLGLII